MATGVTRCVSSLPPKRWPGDASYEIIATSTRLLIGDLTAAEPKYRRSEPRNDGKAPGAPAPSERDKRSNTGQIKFYRTTP